MKASSTQQWMLVGRDSTVSLGSESHEAVTRPGPMVTPLGKGQQTLDLRRNSVSPRRDTVTAYPPVSCWCLPLAEPN